MPYPKFREMAIYYGDPEAFIKNIKLSQEEQEREIEKANLSMQQMIMKEEAKKKRKKAKN